MTACRYAPNYKATQPPTCGCDFCGLKWQVAELQRTLDRVIVDLSRSQDYI